MTATSHAFHPMKLPLAAILATLAFSWVSAQQPAPTAEDGIKPVLPGQGQPEKPIGAIRGNPKAKAGSQPLSEIRARAEAFKKQRNISPSELHTGTYFAIRPSWANFWKQFLGNNSSLIKLLQSESADFKVILIGSEHQVAIIPKIESSEEG